MPNHHKPFSRPMCMAGLCSHRIRLASTGRGVRSQQRERTRGKARMQPVVTRRGRTGRSA